MGHYDVGVVGAGVHGASAARHLSARGARVVVYERDSPAGGPTGLSSAVCRAYYTNPFLGRMAAESLRVFGDFSALTDGGDAGFRRTGAVFLHGPDDVPAVRRTVDMLAGLGLSMEMLSDDDLTRILPGVNDRDIGCAVWDPGAGYADPVGTTNGLLAQARRCGAQLRTATTVTSIAPGAPVQVTHTGGVDTVDRLLVAAGPWTAGLLRTAGVRLPLTAERHFVARCGYPAAAARPPFVVADMPGGYYWKPESGDQFLLGSVHPAEEVDPDAPVAGVRDEECEDLAEALRHRVPAMGEATLRGGWAGLYDVSPDWQPVIGEVAERVFVTAGTSGHGFKLAPALGEQVARLVLDDDPHPDLAQFHPDRFDRGERLAGGYGAAQIIG
ncbi:NAD(P)/FAD-dependent oxidoreductase [Streptomyces albus]|uniref:NAD(P)/FAD-dependent oxidoreductase n=1 Tax=Streptomyces sp. PHES57 TaxID=2872626 RepID=UPI0027E1EA53|nr:FAD-dependent oxidoreductase [Streptomyces sp. PHES57]